MKKNNKKQNEIINNLLPKIFYEKLDKILMSNYFPWFFQWRTTNQELDTNYMFTHWLFQKEQSDSNWFCTFEPIIYFINEKYKINKLLRMKLNLYPNQNKKIKHTSHHDYPDNLNDDIKIGLLNFTTCNGGTIIDGKLYNSNANEIIIFDNKLKHSGITQTDTSTRVILNICWK